MGHTDCTITLAEAIEKSEMPHEVFCYEGTTKHLTGLNDPRVIHAPTTSCMLQVIMNLVIEHVEKFVYLGSIPYNSHILM